MMKVLVYGAQKDEYTFYDDIRHEYGFSFTFISKALSMENIEQTRGFDGLIIMTNCPITDETAHGLAANGVKYLAARSAGTDHIDVQAVHAAGLWVSNVPFYAPGSIAEHTIMLALNVLRHAKRQARMVEAGNFSMNGLKGRQLGSMTVGVFGTGCIGRETIRLLGGFGCKVLAHDPYPNEEAAAMCTYIGREELLQNADMVFLHCPLSESNYHLINRDTLNSMRDGAYLINTARGGLVEHQEVLKALKSGKLAGFGFDVYENEAVYLRRDITLNEITDTTLLGLLQHENAYYTAHIAFYTDKAIESMIRVSLDNLKEYKETGACRNEVML